MQHGQDVPARQRDMRRPAGNEHAQRRDIAHLLGGALHGMRRGLVHVRQRPLETRRPFQRAVLAATTDERPAHVALRRCTGGKPRGEEHGRPGARRREHTLGDRVEARHGMPRMQCIHHLGRVAAAERVHALDHVVLFAVINAPPVLAKRALRCPYKEGTGQGHEAFAIDEKVIPKHIHTRSADALVPRRRRQQVCTALLHFAQREIGPLALAIFLFIRLLYLPCYHANSVYWTWIYGPVALEQMRRNLVLNEFAGKIVPAVGGGHVREKDNECVYSHVHDTSTA